MNGRILELAKNPNLLQHSDLELLKGEITKYPYVQSLRALYLLGTHRLHPENYTNELSVTAAYTTDKKILYQLINPKTELSAQAPEESDLTEKIVAKEETNVNNIEENVTSEEQKIIPEKYTAIPSKEVEIPQPVYVNGELNRILFPGEEDFMNSDPETIDLESTMESGKIILKDKGETSLQPVSTLAEKNVPREELPTEPLPQDEIVNEIIAANVDEKTAKSSADKFDNPAESLDAHPVLKSHLETAQTHQEVSPTLDYTEEKIIDENNITAQKEEIQDPQKLSFHGLEEFLPDVKIEASPRETVKSQAPKPAANKLEEDMNRLIAEVEAKLKLSKKPKAEPEIESADNRAVNFSETQSFEIKRDNLVEEIPQSEKNSEEKNSGENTEIIPKTDVRPKPEAVEKKLEVSSPAWKPMSFTANTPDALISEKQGDEKIETSATPSKSSGKKESEEIEETKEKFEEEPKDSAFPKKTEVISDNILEKESTVHIQKEDDDSNVPTFINTWQNWLKIDRSETTDKTEISITEIKNKVIENFIEKEPKISKLKEESDFVIKERTDDIWHLMTETLANLYIEQKLYAKAIKAFHVLTEKHPEKEQYFAQKINEIKELRQNK